jgi:hypothetical protein
MPYCHFYVEVCSFLCGANISLREMGVYRTKERNTENSWPFRGGAVTLKILATRWKERRGLTKQPTRDRVIPTQ